MGSSTTFASPLKTEALRLASESRSAQTAARQLGISPKLLYRWQQAQLVDKVGSEQVARDPKVRALRARLKRAEQEFDILNSSQSVLRLEEVEVEVYASPNRAPVVSRERRNFHYLTTAK